MTRVKTTAKVFSLRFSEEEMEWLERESKAQKEPMMAVFVRKVVNDFRTYFGVYALGFQALEQNRKKLGLSQRDYLAAILTHYVRVVQQYGVDVHPSNLDYRPKEQQK